MYKGITTFITVFLALSMQSLQAAPPVKKPADKATQILQSLNNLVGLQALESFAGKDQPTTDGIINTGDLVVIQQLVLGP